jgi:hypothetical protein
MGLRGELYSVRVQSTNDRRTYFLNVKENRTRDLFVTIVESKKREDLEEFERHQIVVFEDDIDAFADELQRVLRFVRTRKGRNTPARPRADKARFKVRRHENSDGGSPSGRDDAAH